MEYKCKLNEKGNEQLKLENFGNLLEELFLVSDTMDNFKMMFPKLFPLLHGNLKRSLDLVKTKPEYIYEFQTKYSTVVNEVYCKFESRLVREDKELESYLKNDLRKILNFHIYHLTYKYLIHYMLESVGLRYNVMSESQERKTKEQNELRHKANKKYKEDMKKGEINHE